MKGMQPPYDNHYGITLLDDVHNYFPALLYEPGQFHSVQDVLNYIRLQVQRRFDLFSNAQRAYVPLQQTVRPPPPQRRAPGPPQPPPGPPSQYLNRTIWSPEIITLMQASMDLTDPMAILMNALRQPSSQAADAAFMEPVVVRPTADQVSAATSIEIVDSEEEVCAICQDSLRPGAEARSINVCDHRFHTGCIDQWFQQNVRCPVCRHDIRDPVAPGTQVDPYDDL